MTVMLVLKAIRAQNVITPHMYDTAITYTSCDLCHKAKKWPRPVSQLKQ